METINHPFKTRFHRVRTSALREVVFQKLKTETINTVLHERQKVSARSDFSLNSLLSFLVIPLDIN